MFDESCRKLLCMLRLLKSFWTQKSCKRNVASKIVILFELYYSSCKLICLLFGWCAIISYFIRLIKNKCVILYLQKCVCSVYQCINLSGCHAHSVISTYAGLWSVYGDLTVRRSDLTVSQRNLTFWQRDLIMWRNSVAIWLRNLTVWLIYLTFCLRYNILTDPTFEHSDSTF